MVEDITIKKRKFPRKNTIEFLEPELKEVVSIFLAHKNRTPWPQMICIHMYIYICTQIYLKVCNNVCNIKYTILVRFTYYFQDMFTLSNHCFQWFIVDTITIINIVGPTLWQTQETIFVLRILVYLRWKYSFGHSGCSACQTSVFLANILI